MRTSALVILFALAMSPASAEPLPLVCTGEVNMFDQGTMKIDASGAMVDLDAGTFTAPVYGTYPIIRSEDTSIAFGADNEKVSTYGSLDRISGKLTMSLMTPAARRAVSMGKSIKMISYVEARCTPARKMF